MRCAIWYHLYNLTNVKNTHGGVLTSVKLQTSACNFTKINAPLWVFFTFFKLYKWYQIVQRVTYKIHNILDLFFNYYTMKYVCISFLNCLSYFPMLLETTTMFIKFYTKFKRNKPYLASF